MNSIKTEDKKQVNGEVLPKNDRNVYIQSFGNDRYHNHKDVVSSELDRKVRHIRRRYKSYQEFSNARVIYEQYMVELIIKYGGVERFNQLLKLNAIEDYIPSKPRFSESSSKTNRIMSEFGAIVSDIDDTKFEVDLDEVMRPNDDEKDITFKRLEDSQFEKELEKEYKAMKHGQFKRMFEANDVSELTVDDISNFDLDDISSVNSIYAKLSGINRKSKKKSKGQYKGTFFDNQKEKSFKELFDEVARDEYEAKNPTVIKEDKNSAVLYDGKVMKAWERDSILFYKSLEKYGHNYLKIARNRDSSFSKDSAISSQLKNELKQEKKKQKRKKKLEKRRKQGIASFSDDEFNDFDDL